MRIPQSKPTSALNKTSKKARRGSAGAVFTLGEPAARMAAPSVSGPATLAPIGDISTLLAVQGGGAEQQRAGAISRGFDTLDALDALKLDVLSGGVSRQKLMHLSSIIEKQRDDIKDPALMNVLDHIELRARVELAKFEQKQKNG